MEAIINQFYDKFEDFEKINEGEFNTDILSKNNINETFLKNMMINLSIQEILKIFVSRDAKDLLFKRNNKPILLKEFVKVVSKLYFNLINDFFGEHIARETKIDEVNVLDLIDLNFYGLGILKNEKTGDKYLISVNSSPFEKMAVLYL